MKLSVTQTSLAPNSFPVWCYSPGMFKTDDIASSIHSPAPALLYHLQSPFTPWELTTSIGCRGSLCNLPLASLEAQLMLLFVAFFFLFIFPWQHVGSVSCRLQSSGCGKVIWDSVCSRASRGDGVLWHQKSLPCMGFMPIRSFLACRPVLAEHRSPSCHRRAQWASPRCPFTPAVTSWLHAWQVARKAPRTETSKANCPAVVSVYGNWSDIVPDDVDKENIF